MLSNIFSLSVPFFCFLAYLIFAFSFAMHSIGIRFDETLIKEPLGEYTGFGNWFIPHILYTTRQSLGDFKVDTFMYL